jgi:hypothetical protein
MPGGAGYVVRMQPRSKQNLVRLPGLDRGRGQDLAVQHGECAVHGDVIRLVAGKHGAVQGQRPPAAVDPQVPVTADEGETLQRPLWRVLDVHPSQLRLTDLYLGFAEFHCHERAVPVPGQPARLAQCRADEVSNRVHFQP